jgi:hypothetical protein
MKPILQKLKALSLILKIVSSVSKTSLVKRAGGYRLTAVSRDEKQEEEN